MFLISVEWLDEAKTRARFNLPGREEWRAEHLDALMHALAEIREEMRPAVAAEPPRLRRHIAQLPASVARLAAISAAELPAAHAGAIVPGPGSRLERDPPSSLAGNPGLTRMG